MINSYKQLTGKYLKANKKRSILTIIGIVLSVALIASIGFFLKGIQDAEIQTYKGIYGSWHVEFTKVDNSLLSKAINNPKVSRSGLMQPEEDIQLDKGVALTPTIASDKALELLPYKIKEGRLPNNKNEIAVEEWTSKYIKAGIKIGDTVSLNNVKYKLVGFLENNQQTQLKNKGILLSKSNNIDMSKAALLLEISPKANLKTAVSEIDKLSSDKKAVINNSYVIDLQGGGNDSATKAMFTTVAIVIAIIVIATIAVIYNSFQISVVERMKQFGLLRAVGMTPKQLRSMVLREATILAVIAIPIGLVCGILAIYGIQLSFKLIGADQVLPMDISISPAVLLISTGVGIVSVYFSALLPAFFAGKISPLVAISSRNSIAKEKIKRRKHRLTRKILGFEGDLALKNIKRNKKRYRITVFSIVISVTLFVTFKSFMDMVINVNGTANEGSKMHFSVIQSHRQSKTEKTYISSDIINKISKLDTVNKVYKGYESFQFTEYIDKSNELAQVKNYNGFYNTAKLDGIEKTMFPLGFLTIYDENSLEASKKYLSAGSIDISRLNNENGVIIINNGYVRDKITHKKYSGPIVNIKIGDEIELKNNDKTSTDTTVKKVKVLAIVNNDPFDSTSAIEGIKLITTEQVAKNLTGLSNINPLGAGIQLKDIKNEDTAKKQIEAATQDDPSLSVIDNIDDNRKQSSIMLMIEILVYGFVIVVSLIGSVNIINTLTTNIILRKREFAALKAIGLTQKGLRKMITLEGILYGIEGTIIGSILASGLSYLMYKGMIGIQDFAWSIPWVGIAIAGAAALIIGYLSVLSPLRRINRENIIETIREDA